MKYHQLTENERYQIYALLKAGLSQKEIATMLNRSASTISRELSRNRGGRGYRPKQAHEITELRRRCAKKSIKITPEIKQMIVRLIRQDLSPQQVVDYLRREKIICLHHETIYQLIYEEKAQGGDLHAHLRIANKPYRKRYGHYDRRGRIANRRSIDERPGIVDERGRVGDWEGDTVIGKGRRGALLTLVERKTLYTVIVKLNGKNAEQLANSAIIALHSMRKQMHTITFDNGLEFAAHEQIADALDTDIYFAHPYASWERGINENTNGLIRQYFPKNTDFTTVTQQKIDHVMNRLNNRPRASRNFKTPNELFRGQRVDLLAA
jgi:transposase, IS30 family